MENQSDFIENVNEIYVVPALSTAVPQESQQIYQQIYSNEFFSDFSFNLQKDGVYFVPFSSPSVTSIDNQLSDSFVAQFPIDYYSHNSATFPSSDQLSFNYSYPVLATPSLQISMAQASPSNYFPAQQNLQYFFIPQQFNGQSFEFTYPYSSQQPNVFDPSTTSSSIIQSNFVNQSPTSSHKNSIPIEQTKQKSINNNNNNNNSAIVESRQERQEKKKLQNRAAAQRSREKEKNLLITLNNENESLKEEYEEKAEEIKRLNSILDRMKEKERIKIEKRIKIEERIKSEKRKKMVINL